MPATFRTRDGDMLDHIAWEYYGSTANREVEQLLEANPGLAAHGLILPAGLEIMMPVISEPVQAKGVRLWSE